MLHLVLGVLALDESYHERLSLKQYQDGKVLAHFNFTRTMLSGTYGSPTSPYEITPKALGEIVQLAKVQELHLTFTQGRWDRERWGSFEAAPQGVQLWAWLADNDIDKQWKKLTHSLAGLFCASLNFMDGSKTSEPNYTFQPKGHLFPNARLRLASLPREVVCTENMTPWSKLLPCQLKAGFASLLSPQKVFDGSYQSMSVHLKQVCQVNDINIG